MRMLFALVAAIAALAAVGCREQSTPRAIPTRSSIVARSANTSTAVPSTVAPTTRHIVEVRAGNAPSLADDAAFVSVVASLGDPLTASVLNRDTVLRPETIPPLNYDKPDDWE